MLTKREQMVLELVMQCKTNRQIAEELNISFHTAKAHIENIYRKENVRSRTELFLKVLKENNKI